MGVCLTDSSDTRYKTWERNVNITQSTCKANAVYYGPEACKLYTVELAKYFEKFTPVIASLAIILGLALTFYGCKFVYVAFGILSGLLVASVFFSFFYIQVMREKQQTQTQVTLLTIGSGLLGVMVGATAFKIARKLAVTVLSAWGGIALFLTVLHVANVTGLIWQYIAIVAGIVFGVLVGKYLGQRVTVVATALTGSYILVRGIATFAGHFPSTFDLMN